MFLFTAVANEPPTRTDLVEDLDRGPYVPGPIGPLMVLNAYNMYLFAYWDGLRLTLLLPLSHSSFWRNVM